MLGIRKSLSFLSILAALLFLALPVFAQTAGAVELVGVVEAMTLDTITVNGQEIAITGAEINTALEIGALVRIEGTLNPDGSISARQVNSVAAGVQPGEAELVGVLERFDSSKLVVNGMTIDISGAELGTGLVVGQMVKVHAAWTAGGWVAREVQLYTPADDAPGMTGEFEMTGTLEAIGDGSITVAGQMIVTTGAEIKSMLVVGVRVKVHVSLVDGVLVAREVENAIGDDNSNSNANSNDNSDDSNSNDNANSNDNSDDNNSNDNQVGSPQLSAQQAIDIVLAIYPNTSIVEIKLDDKFGGILVWEIKTSHGLELNIDAQTGVILTIEDRHNGDDGGNFNSNDNGDDGGNFNSNSNSNDDDHGGRNDNGDDDNGNDDNGNDNGDDSNDNNDN